MAYRGKHKKLISEISSIDLYDWGLSVLANTIYQHPNQDQFFEVFSNYKHIDYFPSSAKGVIARYIKSSKNTWSYTLQESDGRQINFVNLIKHVSSFRRFRYRSYTYNIPSYRQRSKFKTMGQARLAALCEMYNINP